MSRSINRVTLLGHLGKDAEIRFTPSGVPRAQFSLATSRRWKPKDSSEWKEETDWHNCILWRCANVQEYLTKGKQVFIEGRLQTRTYEKDGQKHWVTEVICDELVLLGGGGDGSRPASSAGPRNASAGAPDPMGISDEDVPY